MSLSYVGSLRFGDRQAQHHTGLEPDAPSCTSGVPGIFGGRHPIFQECFCSGSVLILIRRLLCIEESVTHL